MAEFYNPNPSGKRHDDGETHNKPNFTKLDLSFLNYF